MFLIITYLDSILLRILNSQVLYYNDNDGNCKTENDDNGK